MEGDVPEIQKESEVKHFNPLPPHGGRLSGHTPYARMERISIHSLRMEGDMPERILPTGISNFNPLPPHGGRPLGSLRAPSGNGFQSTPSAWRETQHQM